MKAKLTDNYRLGRMVLEGVVIVFSILLAFGIDAWWSNRNASIAEESLVYAVRIEAESNRTNLNSALNRNRLQVRRIGALLTASHEELRSLPPDSVNLWLQALAAHITFDAEISAVQSLLGGIDPGSGNSNHIRQLAASWNQEVSELAEENGLIQSKTENLVRILARHIATSIPDDMNRMSLQRLGRSIGPELLVQLQSDKLFVAASLEKTHFQSIYLYEMRNSLRSLDALLEALSQSE